MSFKEWRNHETLREFSNQNKDKTLGRFVVFRLPDFVGVDGNESLWVVVTNSVV